MSVKSKRLAAVVQLVSEQDISTQEVLRDKLCDMGFNVTQTTVSRDIRELALIKIPAAGGGSKYCVPELKRKSLIGDPIIQGSIKTIDYAMNTVVIKCVSGTAQAVCAKLDSTQLYNAVGTLAGDDTIFILMRSERDASRLTAELRQVIDF